MADYSPKFPARVLSMMEFRERYRTELKDRLEAVYEKSDCAWIPEDLYRKVMNTDYLPVSFEDEDKNLVGLGIICITDGEFCEEEKSLLVVAFQCDNLAGLLEDAAQTWDALANQYGLKSCSFSATRKGWKRVAKSFDSYQESQVYTKVYE